MLSICLSLIAAFLFRFHFFPEAIIRKPEFLYYAQALLGILPVFFFCYRAYGLYQPARHIRRIEEIFLVIKANTLAIIVLMALTFFYRAFSYSRLVLVFLWLFSMICVGLSRYITIQLEYVRKRNKKEQTRVLLIGANRNARNIIQWAKNNAHYGVDVIGVLSREPSLVGKHLESVAILGVVEQCENFIQNLQPDEVVLLDKDFNREKITDLVILCEDKLVNFKVGADFYGLMSRNVDVEYISTVPLLGFRSLPLDDPWNRLLKRSFDVCVSTFLLILSLPVWAFVFIIIKSEDGGPVFYRQERMGRDTKLFDVLKFRTMRVNAETESGPVWSKPDDERRTRLGSFLRQTNLDELPQLLNVLRGDMTLVGPRPERPHFIEQFRDAIPRYMARHRVKSGLTGWAQVNGYRGNTSIYERTKYDLYYMENWSLLFDMEILLMTFFAFRNAY